MRDGVEGEDVAVRAKGDEGDTEAGAVHGYSRGEDDGGTEGGTSGPEHLDLSGVTIDPGHLDDFDDEAAARYMNNALRRWQLPSQTQKISLGGWWNENLEGILTERGLEVVR